MLMKTMGKVPLLFLAAILAASLYAPLPAAFAEEAPSLEEGGMSPQAVGDTFIDNGSMYRVLSDDPDVRTVTLLMPVTIGGILEVPATVINLDSPSEPYQVVEIASEAFLGYSNLNELNLTNASNLSVIRSGAFKDCINLSVMNFYGATALTEIEESAFSGCTGFGSLDLGGATALAVIGARAFEGCTGISDELVLPQSIETIGDFAFNACSGLIGLDLDGAAVLTTIGASAFAGCVSFSGELIVPAGVESIGGRAFYQCPFDSLVFGGTPVSAGANLFGDGNDPSMLAHITFMVGPAPAGWSADAFAYVPRFGILDYPCGAAGFERGVFGTPWLDEWQRKEEPHITSVAAMTIAPGGSAALTATGTAPLSWGLAGQPAGVSIDSATGLLSVSSSQAPGTYPFTVAVSNGCGSASQPFTLTVSSGSIAGAGSGTGDGAGPLSATGDPVAAGFLFAGMAAVLGLGAIGLLEMGKRKD